MLVDGDVDQRELNFCKTIAMKMGYRVEVINLLLVNIPKEKFERSKSEALLNLLDYSGLDDLDNL